jgi:hypothetical protein
MLLENLSICDEGSCQFLSQFEVGE